MLWRIWWVVTVKAAHCRTAEAWIQLVQPLTSVVLTVLGWERLPPVNSQPRGWTGGGGALRLRAGVASAACAQESSSPSEAGRTAFWSRSWLQLDVLRVQSDIRGRVKVGRSARGSWWQEAANTVTSYIPQIGWTGQLELHGEEVTLSEAVASQQNLKRSCSEVDELEGKCQRNA